MKNLFRILMTIALLPVAGCSQSTSDKKTAEQKVGGNCEGCEAIHESPVAFEKLENMVWLPDWKEKESHPDQPGIKLAVNGTVYNADGTPAPGVIIYIYHTDQTGVYPTRGDEKGWAKRHGYLRGWMKTNEKGEYKFFTLRPAPYPGGKAPAHIHVTIKEPGKSEYWIDEYLFDDDSLLTEAERKSQPGRGGSGILKIPAYYAGKNMLKSERNIYLGRNIPGYNQ